MTTKKEKTLSVSKRALIQRINRQLAKEQKALRKARHLESQIGDYFIIDSEGNIVQTNIDLESLGRKLGIIAKYERVS